MRSVKVKRCSDCLSALYWCEDQWVCLNCGAEFAESEDKEDDGVTRQRQRWVFVVPVVVYGARTESEAREAITRRCRDGSGDMANQALLIDHSAIPDEPTALPRRERWNVWSGTPDGRGWGVVDSGTEWQAKRIALRRNQMMRQHGVAYMALPEGKTPND